MKNIRQYSSYVLAYLLWVVSLAGGLWVVLRFRDAILTLLVVASMDRYQAGAGERLEASLRMRATDVWTYLMMGVILIVMVVVLETVYRVGAQKNEVWARFSLVTAIELGVLFLSELAITLSKSAVKPLTWGDFIIPIIYLVPTLLFTWLWFSIRPKTVEA